MVLEKAVRTAEIRTELPTTKGTKLGLAYTDDIDLVGNSVLTMKDIFNSRNRVAVNEEKKKYVCMNRMVRRDKIGQNTINFRKRSKMK